MTDDTTTIVELDLSAITSAETAVRQLIAASETWNMYIKTSDAQKWITDTAIRALNVSKMLREPIPDAFFRDIIDAHEPACAIVLAMQTAIEVEARLRRYIDVSMRGLVIAAAHRILAEIEIRAAAAAMLKESEAAA